MSYKKLRLKTRKIITKSVEVTFLLYLNIMVLDTITKKGVNIMSELNAVGYARDYGPLPFSTNVAKEAMNNNFFRTALWTGNYLQMTLMSINSGESIGLESHSNLDQFLYIVEGNAIVKMGRSKDKLFYKKAIGKNFGVFVPAGTWHNMYNTGKKPIKLFSIYAPVQHPRGTVHKTKAEAD